MYTQSDLRNLIEMAGVYPMENGWQVVIRCDWVDRTDQQPHAIDYAMILQDEYGDRLLGIDNAHKYDGALETEPWDHEHRAGRLGQRFAYKFVSAAQLITDFFELVESYCERQGVSSEFISDEDNV